ncbi:MAG: poly-beta-1,6-N-acetyl-D-glucosamine biosynthesis protein PgaD [Eubacterium sp.]|nr:poly-beta-1,6-N-acetyl-D-glucosamine biosynthesis protein PgaD [Eubacterium sp.]
MLLKNVDNGSLSQKVDYDLDEHLIVGRQKKWKKIIEWIITIIGWIVMLTYVLYVIYGNLAIKNNWIIPNLGIFNKEMIQEVNRYYYILFIVLLVSFIVFIIWKNYNKRKYGSFHRREFRPSVKAEEIALKFEMTKAQVIEMQSNKITVLEKNIIPENIGIGNKR